MLNSNQSLCDFQTRVHNKVYIVEVHCENWDTNMVFQIWVNSGLTVMFTLRKVKFEMYSHFMLVFQQRVHNILYIVESPS